MVIFVIPWQAEKNELLKDDEDEIEEEERKKRKRGEQLEKEREERLKHLSEWKTYFCINEVSAHNRAVMLV